MVLSSVPWVPTHLIEDPQEISLQESSHHPNFLSCLPEIPFPLPTLTDLKEISHPLNSSLLSLELSIGCQHWASRIGSFLRPACPKLSPQSHSSTNYLQFQPLPQFTVSPWWIQWEIIHILLPTMARWGQRWLYLSTSLSSLPEVYSSLSFLYI